MKDAVQYRIRLSRTGDILFPCPIGKSRRKAMQYRPIPQPTNRRSITGNNKAPFTRWPSKYIPGKTLKFKKGALVINFKNLFKSLATEVLKQI